MTIQQDSTVVGYTVILSMEYIESVYRPPSYPPPTWLYGVLRRGDVNISVRFRLNYFAKMTHNRNIQGLFNISFQYILARYNKNVVKSDLQYF